MATTTAKGEIGEAMILADLQRQGHDVAIPFGHNLPFDLIVIRREDGRMEKVQCKYTRSDGRVIKARIQSTSAWVHHTYTKEEVDWIGVYDATTRQCLYLHSSVWDGQTAVNLRLTPPANRQQKGVRYAEDYRVLDIFSPDGSEGGVVLPFAFPPE